MMKASKEIDRCVLDGEDHPDCENCYLMHCARGEAILVRRGVRP